MDISIGTQLHVNTDPQQHFGVDHAPALVVAIHDDETVNLRIFPNGPAMAYAQGVAVFPTEAAARAWLADPATVSPTVYVAWVPVDAAKRAETIAAMNLLLADSVDPADITDVDARVAAGGPAGADEPTRIPAGV